jgi:hypothetical protein
MSTFAVQVAGNGLAAQKVHHPALSVLTGSRVQLGRVYAIQSHRSSVNNNGIGVADVQCACMC